jgi:hypothetical protein
MPCMCWFDPGQESKILVKNSLKIAVDEVLRLEKIGDPLDLSIKDLHKLLDHLYRPESCDRS